MTISLAVGGGYAFRHIHFNQGLNTRILQPNNTGSHLGQPAFVCAWASIYRGEYLGYGGAEIWKIFAGYSPAAKCC